MFAKDAFKALMSIAAAAVSMFLLQLVLARAMGAVSYGEYIYVYTWAATVVLVSKGGLDIASLRFVSLYIDKGDGASLKGFVRFAIGAVLLGSALVSAAWALVSLYLGAGDGLLGLLFVATPLLFALPLMEVLGGMLRGQGRVFTALLPQGVLLPALVMAAVAVSVHVLGFVLSPLQTMAAVVLAMGVVVAVQGYRVWRLLLAGRRERPRYAAGEWLRTSVPMALTTGSMALVRQLDIIFVGAMLGAGAAGTYAVASRLVRFVRFGLRASNFIAAPAFSRLHGRGDTRDLQKTASEAARATLLISVPVFGALLLGGGFILGLFGEEFLSALPVLYVLVLGESANVLCGTNGTLLNMTGLHRSMTRIQMSMVVLDACLLYLFILNWGIIGAAAATSATILVRNLWAVWTVWKERGVNTSVLSRYVIFPRLKGVSS